MLSPEPHNQPSVFRWLTAAAGLLLPVIGVVTALVGVFEAGRGDAGGLYWIGAGVSLILADMIVDWLWAKSGTDASNEANLNERGSELIGQFATVSQPIVGGGRGAVRVGDTVWIAEGAEAAAGTRVKVVGVNGTALVVERV
jgi:membrane protein implicated in regulation of membrane protease activity